MVFVSVPQSYSSAASQLEKKIIPHLFEIKFSSPPFLCPKQYIPPSPPIAYIMKTALAKNYSGTSRKRPHLLSDHLTKFPIGSSVNQIAISETSRKRPPLLSDHLTKILIGSSVSQIAISETSRKRPPKPDIKGGCLREVPL